MTLHLLTTSNFQRLVGKPLALIGEGLPITAVLSEITEQRHSSMPGATRTAFSLFFLVRQGEFPHVRSAHYTIDGDGLEAIGPVYMERVLSQQAGIVRLEAAFN